MMNHDIKINVVPYAIIDTVDITDASAIPTLVDELFKTIPRKSYTCTRNLTGGVNLDYRRTAKVSDTVSI